MSFSARNVGQIRFDYGLLIGKGAHTPPREQQIAGGGRYQAKRMEFVLNKLSIFRFQNTVRLSNTGISIKAMELFI